MEELAFHKIVIDSRTASAGTAESFEVTLPETLALPHHAVCYVTDVAVSHSFLTVDGVTSVASRNHYLYFLERDYRDGAAQTWLNRATLTEGAHTPDELAAEVQTQMNANSMFGTSGYTVSYVTSKNALQVVLDYTNPDPLHANFPGFLLVNDDLLADGGFKAYADSRTQSSGSRTYTLNWQDPQSAAGLVGLGRGSSLNMRWPLLEGRLAGSPPSLFRVFPTGHVDVRHRHAIYLHSQALSNLRAIGPAGTRTVIARIPVTSIYGGVLMRQHSGHVLDFVACGGRTLRTLDFSLRDSFGRLIDLRGGHVSFEILFAPKPLV